MAKPLFIEFSRTERIPILYEDRTVLALDKPRGWMLVPFTWQRTDRNLQAAITSSIAAGDYWARARNIKYLRHIHRFDADTTGILLFAKSQGALGAFSDLFETRRMEKCYLAVVQGVPKEKEWSCRLPLAPDPNEVGRMKTDASGKPAETSFRVLQTSPGASPRTLIEARPITGRTHQIRVHLAVSALPVVGDPLYGLDRGQRPARVDPVNPFPLGLRAVELVFTNPFTRCRVCIQAPAEEFLRRFGFSQTGH